MKCKGEFVINSGLLTLYHFCLKSKNQNWYEITKIIKHPEESRFLNWALGKCLGLQLDSLWWKKGCFPGTKNWLLRKRENRWEETLGICVNHSLVGSRNTWIKTNVGILEVENCVKNVWVLSSFLGKRPRDYTGYWILFNAYLFTVYKYTYTHL